MKTETYGRATPRPSNFNPNNSPDIISSDSLKTQSFMGNYSDAEIEASIRKTREQHKEIQFTKPTNFSGRYR